MIYYIYFFLFILIFAKDSFSDQLIKVRILEKYNPQSVVISVYSGNYYITDVSDDKIVSRLVIGSSIKVSVINKKLNVETYSEVYGRIGSIGNYNSLKLVSASDELSILTIKVEGKDKVSRKYRGEILLSILSSNDKENIVSTNDDLSYLFKNDDDDTKVDSDNSEILIINRLSVEEYLYSVVPCEIEISSKNAQSEYEAIKAQAVVSRTFTYKNLKRHYKVASNQWEAYNLCDLTHCQVYKGYDFEKDISTRAVKDTRDEVISYNGEIAQVFYHSTCGGKTSAIQDIWNSKPLPYLVSVDDREYEDDRYSDYCRSSPHYYWLYNISKEKLFETLKKDDRTNPGRYFNNLEIVSRAECGRVTLIKIIGEHTILIDGWKFRMILCQHLGWATIKSTLFEIYTNNTGTSDNEMSVADNFTFQGRGLGHGIGLCQWGAREMSKRGYNYMQIIQHYFPQTGISIVGNR